MNSSSVALEERAIASSVHFKVKDDLKFKLLCFTCANRSRSTRDLDGTWSTWSNKKVIEKQSTRWQ